MSFRNEVGPLAGPGGFVTGCARKTALLIVVGMLVAACGGSERTFAPGTGGSAGAGGSGGSGGTKDGSVDGTGTGGSSVRPDASDGAVSDGGIVDDAAA